MANHQKSQLTAVVMVPLPAQGHLNQLLHLCRLVSAAGLPVHYVGAATHVRQARLRFPAISDGINFHEFETPSFHNPLPDPHSPFKFPSQIVPSLSASTHLRRPVFGFVNDLSKSYRRVVVIYDSLMAYVVQDIDSAVPNAESYCFWSISAFSLYYFKWDKDGRPDIPGDGSRSILQEFSSPDEFFEPGFLQFRSMQRASRKTFHGDIYNSSRVIEGLYLDLLASGAERQWAMGPFNPVVIDHPEKKQDSRTTRHKCLDWLDKQGSADSVIFVSFGTTTSISDEQIRELAIGLEKSEQKFIWVLRDADKGDIFNGEVRKPVLPEGFEERVRERGIVVRDWAPQLAILGHFATGGFMSHCGWNSCMESMSMGVPIATWPMHSDQPLNAALVTKVLKIGVEVKDWAHKDEVVPSSVVESAVRKLMATSEGDEIRKRAKELGDAVKSSVMEGGIRNREIDSFITHITR